MHSFKELQMKIAKKKQILKFFDVAINFDETTTLRLISRNSTSKHLPNLENERSSGRMYVLPNLISSYRKDSNLVSTKK